jgi:hypothetical protein
MSLLSGYRASATAWTGVVLAALAPLPLLAPARVAKDPCALQYKPPSYDRRIFTEVASGFAVPLNRTLPYVVTPRIELVVPLDQAYQWNLSESGSVRFGDNQTAATLGARLYRSIISSSGGLMPGVALGLGPDLVLAHNGGVDAVAELTVDLTPLMLGARASWGPLKFNDQAFTRPARLETFIGWRIAGWRRASTMLDDYLHQPPPPRRRFHPQTESDWAEDFQDAVEQIPLPEAAAYLSLVQQLTIRLGAEFKHGDPECGNQLKRLKDARASLSARLRDDPDSLRHGADSLSDVRYPVGLTALLREQSEAFATALDQSLEYAKEAEDYIPDRMVLAPAVMHATSCVLDGALSPSCVRVQP